MLYSLVWIGSSDTRQGFWQEFRLNYGVDGPQVLEMRAFYGSLSCLKSERVGSFNCETPNTQVFQANYDICSKYSAGLFLHLMDFPPPAHHLY